MDPTAVQKQRANVFTMLLILSFMALVAGSVFLYLEMQEYDHKMKPTQAVPQPVTVSAENPA